ncbi:MAG: four helix bundle protein [Crocinitomicaceae bacterium]|nr:four helix bundle protein [Crocinitomicaceae bacterium]
MAGDFFGEKSGFPRTGGKGKKRREEEVCLDQLLRAGTSPALNYGEAQSAESRKDFVHKMKIVLKELRETQVGLKIIEQAHLLKSTNQLSTANKECNELLLFVKH